MLSVFQEALELFFNDKNAWAEIQANAKKMRFTWEKSVDASYSQLYRIGPV